MQNDIRHSWYFHQPPEQVWEYLTRADLISQWLMKNDFQLIMGHQFQFQTGPIPALDLDGIFHCRVLEIVPFRKLAYSWKGGPGNGVFTLDTVVEWSLQKHGNGTKLLLKQWGFKEANFSIFTAMTDGWQKNVQKMITLLNTTNNDSTNV